MRIGTQLYGFQGIDINRKPVKAVAPAVAAPIKSSAAATPTTANSSAAAQSKVNLNELVTELRTLASKPATTASEQSAYTQKVADVQRKVEYLTITEPTTYEVSRTTVSGTNAAQVRDLELSHYESSGAVTISGNVTTAATYAELAIAGDANGNITEDASYDLTTERGVFQIQITGGETLQEAATRITDRQADTGVVATVSGNNLVLKSTTIGSGAQVLLERTDTSPTIVSGQNTAQVSALNVANQTIGTSDTLTGSVTSQASNAELVYQGAANQTIAGSSAFRLTGSAGSVLVSVTQGETLAAVANRLNQQSGSTGVVVTQDTDKLRFTSVDKGSTETVRIDQIVQAETITTTGRNAAQVTSFNIDAIERGAEETLSGQVTQTAGKASLTIQGSGSGTVLSTATFELRGSAGAMNISITKDETLAAVVTRINNLTETTGVTAREESNQVILESTEFGSAAEVEVNLLSLPYTLSTTGRNESQLSSFDVQTFTDGATQTFSGTVTQAAAVAQFNFRGSALLTVNKTSTFTLTGSLGSRQFSTTTTQTLANLASQVNAQSANTGVTATVSGRNIYFRSTGIGSATEINLQVNSGTFGITGADANGSAFGTDAQATVNGVTRTGAGNNFSFTDSKGSYTFSTVQGYTGSISTITVTSTAGTFTLGGGDGNGMAQGTDATAVINGVQQTGTGNNFSVATTNGQYSLGFAAGFTGSFAAITAKSTLDEFSFTGGDQTGTATGTDFVADVNGTEYRGLSNTFTHTTANGSYDLTFDTTFVGQYDPITISTSAGPTITGGNGAGDSVGTDAVATLNGRQFTAAGDKFRYADSEVKLSFTISAGFTGQIDPITIGTTTEVVHDFATRTIELPDPNAANYASSSSNISEATSKQAESLNSILKQIDEFNATAAAALTAVADSYDDDAMPVESIEEPAPATTAVPEPLTRAQLVGQLYQQIAQNKMFNQSPALQNLLKTNLSLLQSSLDLQG